MKITFILPGVFISGGVRAVFECANGLKARGHEVNVVFPAARLYSASRCSFHYVCYRFLVMCRELLRPVAVDWFPLKTGLVRVPALIPAAVPLFSSRIPEADVVVATSWETAEAVLRLAPSKGRKAYFVQHYEVMELWSDRASWDSAMAISSDMDKVFFSMASVSPADAALRRYKTRVDSTYSAPLAKFTTSTMLEDFITGKFGQRCFGKVPIGNEASVFYPEGGKARSNELLVPMRGYWKGSADILRMLDILRSRRSDFHAVMFGPEECRNDVPAWAEFHSGVSDDDLRRLYSRADVFVSPSWVEGWGSPLMEAMSCGTACVGTTAGAARDYAEDGKTALLVPPRNPEALASAVERLFDDAALRDRLASAGQESIRAYTWERAVDALEGILERICSIEGKD